MRLKGLTGRLLIFNLLLAVFPVGAMLFLGTYERQLLESQERAMVQQGRLLASALVGHDLADEAESILGRLGARTDARLRVVDQDGRLLADSAAPAESEEPEEPDGDETAPSPSRETGEPDEGSASYPEESVIYRIGALPARTVRYVTGFTRPPVPTRGEAEFYVGKAVLDGPEIQAALNGRYGAATRISSGQRSVTLYSAIPILRDKDVIGAVLVSRSTFAILTDLYRLRLDIMQIFLISVGAAVLLSILLARTVTVPVGRLRDQAESLLDERGKLTASFKPLSARDEVADLSRALHRLSSRLQERTDHLEDFMADLVHEMKNPVAGILSAAELADGTAGEETRRFLAVIEREGRRIQRLLDDLRELISVDVRLDQGEGDRADVDRVLRTIVEGYPWRAKRGVTVVYSGCPDAAEIDVDPDRLAQAVINLVDNAVSFSPDEGTVDVDLECSGEKPARGTVRISVADRGPGIPPEAEGRVFERWYTDRPESEATTHTGLGLAIVRGIAEGYGGRVSAEARDGGGAVFVLEFPRKERR